MCTFQIKKTGVKTEQEIIIHAFISSHLDYCSADFNSQKQKEHTSLLFQHHFAGYQFILEVILNFWSLPLEP